MAAKVVEQLLVELDARTDALEAAIARSKMAIGGFARSTEGAGAAGEAMGGKYGHAALRIAGATETMARMGEVGGQAGKQVLASAANIAFAFGAGGAIVGAIGVATIAIAEHFSKIKEEAHKAVQETIKEFAAIGKLSASAAVEGITDIDKKLPRLKAEADAAQQKYDKLLAMKPAEYDFQPVQDRAIIKAREEALRMNEALEKQKLLRTSLYAQAVKQGEADQRGREVVGAYDRQLEAQKKAAEELARAPERAAEAAKKLAEEVLGVQQAFTNAGDALAQFSNDAVQKLDHEMGDTFKKLAVDFKKVLLSGDPNDAIAYAGRILDFTAKWRDFRAAVVETSAAQRTVVAAEKILDSGNATNAQLGTALTNVGARVKELTATLATLSEGDARYKVVEDELNKALETRKKLVDDILGHGELVKKGTIDATIAAEEHRKKVLEDAGAMVSYGRAAIAAAQALGSLGDAAAANLQNIVSLGEGILKIASGDPTKMVSGITEAVASLAAVLGVGSKGKEIAAAFEASRLKIREALDRLTETLTDAAQALQGVTDAFREQIAAVLANAKAGGGLGGGLLAATASSDPGMLADAIARARSLQGSGKNVAQDTALRETLEDLLKINERYKEAVAKAKELLAYQEQRAEADLAVRDLRAAGKNAEADALEQWNAQVAEFYAAVQKFGGDSEYVKHLAETEEAERKAAAAARELTEALNRIDAGAKILGLSSTEILQQKVAAFAKLFPQLVGVLDGLDLSKAEDVEKFKDRLRAIFKDLPVGELDDLVQAILSLLGVADDVAAGIETAAQKIANAMNQLNQDWDVLGIKDPVERAKQTGTAQGIDLTPYDLSTPEGREAAKGYLRGLYKNATSPAEKAAIQSTIDAIYQIPDATGAPAEAGPTGGGAMAGAGGTSADLAAVRSITLTQADQLVTAIRAVLAVAREQLAVMREILQSMRVTPLAAPQITVADGGHLTILHFRPQFTFDFNGAFTPGGKAQAILFGRELMNYIEKELSNNQLLSQIGKGIV